MDTITRVMVGMAILLIVIHWMRPAPTEGFANQQKESFLSFSDPRAIYDGFYAGVYDLLVASESRTEFEADEIIKHTNPSKKSHMLDLGSGTGHLVAALATHGLSVQGADQSESMVKQARINYPKQSFIVADMMQRAAFDPASFSHVLCMYFTMYYTHDKHTLVRNCRQWLRQGGYLVVHMVDDEQFDPVLAAGNPLFMVSPQRYAKERITKTSIVFEGFEYKADFQHRKDKDRSMFVETFKDRQTGATRQHKHTLYMKPMDELCDLIVKEGFSLEGRVHMLPIGYEYQFLYVFKKTGGKTLFDEET